MCAYFEVEEEEAEEKEAREGEMLSVRGFRVCAYSHGRTCARIPTCSLSLFLRSTAAYIPTYATLAAAQARLSYSLAAVCTLETGCILRRLQQRRNCVDDDSVVDKTEFE